MLFRSHNTGEIELPIRTVKNMGLATLVGEQTGGNHTAGVVLRDLPNTGILFRTGLSYFTDEFGRPYDIGTVPHYFNKDGMDALETVLSLIG